jgi:hypothetical protein
MPKYQVIYAVGSSLEILVDADSREEAEERAYLLADKAMQRVEVYSPGGFWLGELEDVVCVEEVDR